VLNIIKGKQKSHTCKLTQNGYNVIHSGPTPGGFQVRTCQCIAQRQAAQMLNNCSEAEVVLLPGSHTRSVWALYKKYREVYCNIWEKNLGACEIWKYPGGVYQHVTPYRNLSISEEPADLTVNVEAWESSVLKMEAEGYFETSVNFCHNNYRYTARDNTFHLQLAAW
jgi:hypothetical protein